MRLQVVPLEWVPSTWPMVAAFLGSALEHAHGDYTLDHVQAYVASGRWVLVVATEDGPTVVGAATVELFNRPADRVAMITAMGGRFVTTAECLVQLRGLMATLGATCIEAAVRDSVGRLLARLGFMEKYKIVGVTL